MILTGGATSPSRVCENRFMDEDRNIRREVLPNGLSIITEEMKHIRSISIGIWIKTGSLDVLSDLVLNPVFDAQDITRERGVILEEIKMDEDNPDYLVHEIFTQNFWKDHPLGKPILGTKETVRSFERDTLFNFYGSNFLGGNMIFSAAGNIKHADFVRLVAGHF